MLPGRCLAAEKHADYLATFKQNLLYAADQFQPLGIKAVFEAVNTIDMPGFIIHSGQQMLEVLQELKHPNVALQYDIYHMHHMGEDCADFLIRHLDKIGHIQFADFPGRGEIGSGQTDFKYLFKIIADSDYNGWTGAEYRPGTSTVESLKTLQQYL